MIGPSSVCPQGIELVLFDLDDTILVDGTYVSSRVLDAIAQVRERGIMACVATGRSRHMVPEQLRSPQYMDYLICSNGATIYDTFGDAMHACSIDRNEALDLMRELKQLKAAWYAYVDDQNYFEWKSMSYLVTGQRMRLTKDGEDGETDAGRGLSESTYLVRGLRFAKRLVTNRDGMHQVYSVRPYVEAAQRVDKLGCSLPSERACERAIAILEHRGGFEVARMSPFELELTGPGATKGEAARWLMDYLHVRPATTVCFGDSQNDLPMADACGTFVAMTNSDSIVIERADDVCGSVYDDGVARWLECVIALEDGRRHAADE